MFLYPNIQKNMEKKALDDLDDSFVLYEAPVFRSTSEALMLLALWKLAGFNSEMSFTYCYFSRDLHSERSEWCLCRLSNQKMAFTFPVEEQSHCLWASFELGFGMSDHAHHFYDAVYDPGFYPPWNLYAALTLCCKLPSQRTV